MKEGHCKTEDQNHLLQIVLGKSTDLTAFLLPLQASILFPPTEQFALHGFQLPSLLLQVVLETPAAFVSWEVWGYEWLEYVRTLLVCFMRRWLESGNWLFLHFFQIGTANPCVLTTLIGFLMLTSHLYLWSGSWGGRWNFTPSLAYPRTEY